MTENEHENDDDEPTDPRIEQPVEEPTSDDEPEYTSCDSSTVDEDGNFTGTLAE